LKPYGRPGPEKFFLPFHTKKYFFHLSGKNPGQRTKNEPIETMKKHTLHVSESKGGLFNRPAQAFELEVEKILANHVIFANEFNPHNVRLWIVGNEYGAMFALWAGNEQDALDTACDENLMESFLVDDTVELATYEEEGVDLTPLGNAGELHNLESLWMREVELSPARDCPLMLAFAEARGGCYETLYF